MYLRGALTVRPSVATGIIVRSLRMAHAPRTSAIQYTICDEAPQLATYALLPVIRRFTKPYNIRVDAPNISLAARILAQFPERLSEKQRQPDALAMLGELTQKPEANIIKLPNISASIPQLNEAIAELQAQGYKVPDYPAQPKTEEEQQIAARYAKVLGSAVNPVLREGNSDRRVAPPVKANAQRTRPPVKMRTFRPECRSNVATMTEGDFFGSEKSLAVGKACKVKIEFVDNAGKVQVLKKDLALKDNEVIDASVMSRKHLRAFFEKTMQQAKKDNMMLSLHLKATMMKISDPIIFGHAVSVYFNDVFEKHRATLAEIGANPNNGLASVLDKINGIKDSSLKAKILDDIKATYAKRPGLAMVDSAKGITNLHVPNDVIIDASMPPLIRDGGQMWNKEGNLEDTIAMIPDRCYSGIYQVMIDDCRKHGQFDHSTMGSVANVGLMAQKAEEYGSHDKTFQMTGAGTVRVVDLASGAVYFQHQVEQGDIWRMCQTKDAPIVDWVGLAVRRARATGDPAIFWLDKDRAHDNTLISKINVYLKQHDTQGLDISILPPAQAMAATLKRVRAGKNTISVTGNVLRDYLTDLFPILELGTSAKMLSIVPLLAGGGLFETGAGGSAPKHVEQFLEEGHLRWDSLGEYLALAVSFEHMGERFKNAKATMLSETLNEAIGKLLDNNKSPSRKAKEIDNRGSSFYVSLYWAQALAKRDPSFADLAKKLEKNEQAILKDLLDCQGSPVDVGGYYHPDDAKAEKAMRPSKLYNNLIDN